MTIYAVISETGSFSQKHVVDWAFIRYTVGVHFKTNHFNYLKFIES